MLIGLAAPAVTAEMPVVSAPSSNFAAIDDADRGAFELRITRDSVSAEACRGDVATVYDGNVDVGCISPRPDAKRVEAERRDIAAVANGEGGVGQKSPREYTHGTDAEGCDVTAVGH